ADYRMDTYALGQGEQDGSTWIGTVVLKGAGDPTLSLADLRSLAAQVQAAGISRITGGIIADESLFDSRRIVAGWKASFYVEESPPLSALVVNRARVGPYTSRSPALAAGSAFRDALLAVGIDVAGSVRVGRGDDYAVPLGVVSSAPLSAILRFMDRKS